MRRRREPGSCVHGRGSFLPLSSRPLDTEAHAFQYPGVWGGARTLRVIRGAGQDHFLGASRPAATVPPSRRLIRPAYRGDSARQVEGVKHGPQGGLSARHCVSLAAGAQRAEDALGDLGVVDPPSLASGAYPSLWQKRLVSSSLRV